MIDIAENEHSKKNFNAVIVTFINVEDATNFVEIYSKNAIVEVPHLGRRRSTHELIRQKSSAYEKSKLKMIADYQEFGKGFRLVIHKILN